MNNLEKKMVETLIDLKENHHIIGVKAEFEAEGTRMEEALRLKEIVTKANLDLTIKIGGCEAIKDMFEARTLGVSTIVAPMIETAYAMKKYTNALKYVFPKEELEDINTYINIETITGFNNFDEMLESEEFKSVTGIVLGRVDMTGSMGMSREDINTDKIFKIAETLAKKIKEHNKDFIIGGGVSAQSLEFFRKLPQNSLKKFETRKIIFDAQKAIADKNAGNGILKAVGFELMWLRNKRDFYKMIYEEDLVRFQMLEKRYKKSIEEAGGICI
jgi:hypothetical protein